MFFIRVMFQTARPLADEAASSFKAGELRSIGPLGTFG
jgi:hypothetical protein